MARRQNGSPVGNTIVPGKLYYPENEARSDSLVLIRAGSASDRSVRWDCAARDTRRQSQLNHRGLVSATAATATQDRPATGRSHTGAKAKRTLAFNLADSAGIMHRSNPFLGTRPLKQLSGKSESHILTALRKNYKTPHAAPGVAQSRSSTIFVTAGGTWC